MPARSLVSLASSEFVVWRTAQSSPFSTCPLCSGTTKLEFVMSGRSVANSSLVVPLHSVQVENGVDWAVRHTSNSLDASDTRLRAGIAHCTEFLIDVPSYFGSLNG